MNTGIQEGRKRTQNLPALYTGILKRKRRSLPLPAAQAGCANVARPSNPERHRGPPTGYPDAHAKNPIIGLCQQATFLISAAKVDQCPEDIGLEVAFAGRSNAGKSSALNTLTHASLARTSKTPGRTQLLNFFRLDDERRLVDLPVTVMPRYRSRCKRHWQKHLEAYLGSRESLSGLVLMMDIRHPLTEFDCMMLDWSVASGMPLHILLTKADKLAFGAAKTALLKVRQEIHKQLGRGHQHPAVLGTQAHGRGRGADGTASWLDLLPQEDGGN